MKYLGDPSSGSYQGITASRNRFGQYKRTRAIPVNPASSYQTAVRARLATNASNWRSLTATQREGWGSFGSNITRADTLGQYYTLNGYEAFCLVNNNRLAAGDAVLTDPIAYDPPDPMTSVTLTATIASLSVAYTPTPVGAAERVFVALSPLRSAGRLYEGDLRLIAVTAAAGASPANVLAAYQARFGTPTVGSKIFCSVQRYAAGLLSPAILTSVIVA